MEDGLYKAGARACSSSNCRRRRDQISAFGSRRHVNDQLAIANGNAISGVVGHAHLALFVTQPISHIEPDLFLAAVVHGAAALLVCGVRVALLYTLLNTVACVTSRSRARGRGNLATIPSSDLVTEHPAHHGADYRAGHAVFVLRRRLARDRLCVTNLAG